MTLHELFAAEAANYFDNVISYLKAVNLAAGGNENMLNAIEYAEECKETAIKAIHSI